MKFRLALIVCVLVLGSGISHAAETTAALITISPHIDWTSDGQVLITTTILPTRPQDRFSDAQLRVSSPDGVVIHPLPTAVGTSLGRALTVAESRLAAGPATLKLGTLRGAQVAGLFAVPHDHASTIELTVTATTSAGPVTVTKTVTVDPSLPHGNVVMFYSPTEERANAVFPARSHAMWKTDVTPP